MSKVNAYTRDRVRVVEIDRPEVRNAVDLETSRLLHDSFEEFDADPEVDVAILTGAGGNFCAGADLHALATEVGERARPDGPGPMGPTRLSLSKPVIAAVEGYAVAGGLELALWCDMRVASESAVFGVFCRRFGVPLIDGGTVRLPRLVGQSRALDMILTGRGVEAREAETIGLANRLVGEGSALAAAIDLASQIGSNPQVCMRNDRASVYAQWGLDTAAAMSVEFDLGMKTIGTGETMAGAAAFHEGAGRHGAPRAD
jgi:enoyl-CoA hydratase